MENCASFALYYSGTLKDLATRDVYPVDLNSLLALNAHILQEWFRQIGDKPREMKYESLARQRNSSIEKFLYDPLVGKHFLSSSYRTSTFQSHSS